MTKINDEILDELIKKEPNESTTAYSAFCYWIQLPVAERRAEDAMYRTAEYSGLEISTLRVYRVEHRWDERVNMLDAHFARVNFQKRLDMQNESNLRFAEETKEIQEESVKVARKALAAANQLLDTLPMANKVIESEWVVTRDGKKVPLKTEIKMEAKASDIAPLIRVAVETPMKAIGLPTEVVKPNVLPGPSSVKELSDDDIAAKLEMLAKERAKIIGTQNVSGIQ